MLLALAIIAYGFLALAVERPVLNISTSSGTNVLVSWPGTNTGFLLQATTNLVPATNWSSVSNVQLLSGSFQMVEPMNSKRFYRLVNDPNAADIPDPSFIDSNGDGIDGDKQKAIFVARPPFGNDSNQGTMLAPVATLEHGIALASAQNKDVYVAAGTYSPAGPLQLASGVSLYGLYDGTTNWGRGTQNMTIISGNSTAVVATFITKETHIEGFSITAASPPAPGISTYGVFVANLSSNVVIRYNSISAGNGAEGSAGTSSPSQPPASAGLPGLGGTCDGGNGSGGAGAGSVCGRFGGAGGRGGPEGANNGSPGTTGAGGTAGGAGGQGGNPGGSGQNGVNGAIGANGSNGAAASSSLATTPSGYLPADGNAGSAGSDGNGGGGGGGGGGQGCFFCNDGGGNGGGGGGAGGCGGVPGTGGGGGGGAFAVFVYGASAVISDNTLSTGNGGNGGPGGNGAAGGSGGAGAFGAVVCTAEVGAGGNGGSGGNGGTAGSGSGGSGGPSIGVFYANSSVSLGSNVFLIGHGGLGGPGGANVPLGTAPNGPNGVGTNVLTQ